jgi:hypothetical protein
MNLLKRAEVMYKANLIINKKIQENIEKISTNMAKLFIENAMRNSQVYSFIKAWEHYGKKTFRLSSDLVKAFYHTDINLNCTPEEFKYPFDSFIIESDIPFFKLLIEGDDICKNVLVECLLFINKNALMQYIKDNNISDEIEFNGVKMKLPDFQFDFILYGFAKGDIMYGLDSGLYFIFMTRKNSASILLKSEINKEVTRDEIQELANAFFNTVMYINDPSRNKDETEEKCVVKTKLPHGKSGLKHYIYLKAPSNYKPIKEGNYKKIDKRFMVRGHWKQQACGEKWSQHKKVWIFPFYKGPEFGINVNNIYKVK